VGISKRFSLASFLGAIFFAAASIGGWMFFYDDHSAPGTAILGGYRERWFLLNLFWSYLAIWAIVLNVAQIGKIGGFRIVGIHLGVLAAVASLETFALIGLIDFRTLVGEVGAGKLYGKLKPDHRIRWAGKPNQSVEGTTFQNLAGIYGVKSEPIFFSVQTDHYGLRNPPTKKDPVILLLGDSILFAGLLPLEETVTERLEAELNTSVMNISEPGYSPQEELIRLESTRLDLRGRVVLHFIFEGNDLTDSQAWRAWQMRRFESEWPSSGLSTNLLSFLHAPKIRVADRRFGFFTNRMGEKVKIYFLYDGLQIASQMNEMPFLESAFAEVKRNIENCGGVYAIVFVPAKITVLHKYCVWPKGSDFESADRWASPFRAALAEFCARAGIPCQDLTAPLESLAQEGNLPYFAADTHLNAAGHEMAAGFLAPWIKSLITKSEKYEQP
jgi:hypothetical protein